MKRTLIFAIQATRGNIVQESQRRLKSMRAAEQNKMLTFKYILTFTNVGACIQFLHPYEFLTNY